MDANRLAELHKGHKVEAETMTTRERPGAAGQIPFSAQAVQDGYWEIYHDDDCGVTRARRTNKKLARDEAKETSDGRIRSGTGTSDGGQVCGGDEPGGGGGDRRVGTGEVSDTSSGSNVAPVAMSVSASDKAEEMLLTMVRDFTSVGWRGSKSEVMHRILKYASSSSAALSDKSYIQEIEDRAEELLDENKALRDQAEAAEAKSSELQKLLDDACLCEFCAAKFETLTGEKHRARELKRLREDLAAFVALRDSRGRLQEALKGYRENHRSHGCHGRGTDPFISTACAMCCKADAALS